MKVYNIAVILTCFNRKAKTLSCLKGLYSAQKAYQEVILSLCVYLTDDGCTDGTSQAVRETFPDKDITILQGDGNLYWAGGMRFAWREALKSSVHWDFYLLLNDDTIPLENMFSELFNAHQYCKDKFNNVGVYAGVTCDIENPHCITYGGAVWKNSLLGTDERLNPVGIPQEVDKTNANILLVANEIVTLIGIFYEGYRHGAADYDYSIYAKKHGFKALITANVCGKCQRDHLNKELLRKKILAMDRKGRKKYFSLPTNSGKDDLLFKKRNVPLRYPLAWLGKFLNANCPYVYYILDFIRERF